MIRHTLDFDSPLPPGWTTLANQDRYWDRFNRQVRVSTWHRRIYVAGNRRADTVDHVRSHRDRRHRGCLAESLRRSERRGVALFRQ